MNIQIAPSLLSADFANLNNDVKKCERAGIKILHVDVMDGCFVPNITIGPVVVESLRKRTKLILDTHLMIKNPENFVEPFAKAGSDWITFHAETVLKPLEIIKKITKLGLKPGVSINPLTPVSKISQYLDKVFLVLVMSVNPGFGGQKFMPSVLSKVRELRRLSDKSKNKFKVEIDGGINFDTISDAVGAGANIIVAGNTVFRSKYGIKGSINRLRIAAKKTGR
ncbi:MAG: ribulose-phosphate 3-epimerase [Elusimicrobia bacterium]|nr:ribulose-phosphate 3-epimerase [Elusimicrobiota bacterium]